MTGHRRRGVAVVLTVILVVSAVGGVPLAAAAPTVPSDAPAVNVTAETQTPGETTNVTAAYNVTGVVGGTDVGVNVSDHTGVLDSNTTVSTAEGRANLTLPAWAGGGARRVNVSVYDTSTGDTAASNVTVVGSNTNVTVESYSVSKTTVDAGETFTVDATLNNTGSTQATYNATVYAADGSTAALNRTEYTLTGDTTKQISLRVSYPRSYAESSWNLTLNDEPSRSVWVNTPPASVSVPNVSTTAGTSADVTVTYDTGRVDLADANLTLSGPDGLLDHTSLSEPSGTATLTVPASAASAVGEFRVRAALVNDSTGFPVESNVSYVNVTGDSRVTEYTVNATDLVRSNTYGATVTVNNTGLDAEEVALRVYGGSNALRPVGDRTVTVDANAERSYDVTFTYPGSAATGTRSLTVNDESSTAVQLAPLARVASYSVVSGPTNETALDLSTTDPSSPNGLLQFGLRNSSPESAWVQDLNGTGLTNDSRVKVVLEVDHSYDPGALVATAENVSWTVTNESDHYRVEVTGEPTESQFMEGAPSIDEWDSLSESEDRADTSFEPMFSLAFVPDASLTNENLSGMTVATDAQTFSFPRYTTDSDGTPHLQIDLAAPHQTVDGTVNTGRYEATLPKPLVDEWGVDAADLDATYEGSARSLNPTTNADGSVDIGFDVGYSKGTVDVSPADPDGGSASLTVSSGSTGSSSSAGSSSSSDDDLDSSTTGFGSAVASATDRGASVSAANLRAGETVRANFDDAVRTENVSVSDLSFTVGADAESVSVDVSASDAPPAATPALDRGPALGYVEVAHADDAPLDAGTFRFGVSSARLDELGVDPSAVRLYRHHDGEWRELDTRHLGNGVYEADTPGFSVFAVGTAGADVTTTTTAPATTTAAAGDETTTAGPSGTTTADADATETTTRSFPGFGVLAALAAVLAAAVALRRRE